MYYMMGLVKFEGKNFQGSGLPGSASGFF